MRTIEYVVLYICTAGLLLCLLGLDAHVPVQPRVGVSVVGGHLRAGLEILQRPHRHHGPEHGVGGVEAAVQYCTVLYCTVLYCVLCTVLYYLYSAFGLSA